MAQSGYTPILIYSSSTTTNAPAVGNLTNSTLGSELAINITDGKLFYKDNANAIQVIAWKTTPTTAGGTGLTSYTAGDLLYYASGTTLTKLAIGASGCWLGSSGSAPQWNAPAALTKTDDTNVTLTLGGSASTALLNAASLTLGWTGTLATTRGGTGLGSFTANGVMYASSTSALATGSALTFDGTNFATTGAASASRFIPTGSTVPSLGIYSQGANTLSFATNSTLRAYLDSNGAFWINGDNGYSGGLKLSVVGATGDGTFLFKNDAGASQWLGWMWNSATSGNNLFVNFLTDGGPSSRGSITYNRGAGLLAFNTTSDYRSKDIIGVVENSGEVIDTLKIYMGKMKGATIERPMLIAHEAQEFAPYSVNGEKDAVDDKGEPVFQQMDHQSFVPLILAELQSLRARVKELENK